MLLVAHPLFVTLIVCRQQMAVAQEPKHQVRQISSTVRGFKPVARHKEHVSDSLMPVRWFALLYVVVVIESKYAHT